MEKEEDGNTKKKQEKKKTRNERRNEKKKRTTTTKWRRKKEALKCNFVEWWHWHRTKTHLFILTLDYFSFGPLKMTLKTWFLDNYFPNLPSVEHRLRYYYSMFESSTVIIKFDICITHS